MPAIDTKIAQIDAERPFIQRLRHDPRLHAMLDGWAAQAALEAELHNPSPTSFREALNQASHKAAQLALEFLLSTLIGFRVSGKAVRHD